MIGFGMLGRAELAFIVINIAFVQNKIIDITQFYTLMFTAFLLNITVPIALKWWKPYYLGFKEFKVFGVNLAREEPAPVPDDMPEYKEMMEEERKRYIICPCEWMARQPMLVWTANSDMFGRPKC